MGLKFKGLDELQKSLNEISERAEELSNPRDVRLDELFTDSFVRKNTSLKSANEFLEKLPLETLKKSGWSNSDELDNLAREISSANSFQDLLELATVEYVTSQLMS